MTSEKEKTTILNVDDDDAARYAASRILKREGFEVLEAVSGAEALRLVKQAPDLILLDVNLPDVSGFEVCRIIKEDPATSLIPVLHLSATYMDDRSKVKGLDIGADGYLTYPVEPPVLIACINSLLRIGRVQKELEDSAQKWRTTFDAMKNAVSLMDKEQRFLQYNTSMKELVGKPFREIIGRYCWEVMHGTSEPIEGCPIIRMRETLRRETLVLPIGERWFDIAVDPLLDGDGTLTGAVHIMTDITERVRAEEEKKRLEAQFQQAQKMEAMGTLSGGIAHDFNNILMAIQGNASLVLVDKTSSHPDYERLKNIEQGVKSGAELTRQLLGFAMGGKYEVKPTNINELVKRTSGMFGRTKKEIAIHTKYQEGIWPVEVDQGQIEQVLVNLYVNAWQAMPGGGELYLETENVTLDQDYVKPYDLEPGRYVKISITDTGVGMDEATQQRIFEPFFTTREMARGTGLGLASVYGIITNHGGIITVTSVKGEGATFTIHLPASEKEVIKEEELPEEVVRGTETVLLVDDEDMVLDVGKEILKELGYKVLVARSGREAVDIVSKAPRWSKLRTPQGKHRAEGRAKGGKKGRAPSAMPSAPDIVILDMIMPQMGGGETYDRMKEIDPDIKVLLSSGYSINGEATKILERGCNGFIQKPFSMRQLSQEVRKILGG